MCLVLKFGTAFGRAVRALTARTQPTSEVGALAAFATSLGRETCGVLPLLESAAEARSTSCKGVAFPTGAIDQRHLPTGPTFLCSPTRVDLSRMKKGTSESTSFQREIRTRSQLNPRQMWVQYALGNCARGEEWRFAGGHVLLLGAAALQQPPKDAVVWLSPPRRQYWVHHHLLGAP